MKSAGKKPNESSVPVPQRRQKQLERLRRSYEQLDAKLAELEQKMPTLPADQEDQTPAPRKPR